MITSPYFAAHCPGYDHCAIGACPPDHPCLGCPGLLMKRHPPAADLGAGWAQRQAEGPLLGASDSEGCHAD